MEESEEKKEDGSPDNNPTEDSQAPGEPPESAPGPKHEEPPASEERPRQEPPPSREDPPKESERPQQQQEEIKKTEQETPPLPTRKEKMSVSVDQDTFVPPSRRGPSGSIAMGGRPSIYGRRLSASDRNLRKSRFGALSSKARMVLGSIVDIKTNAADFYDKKTARYQNTYKLESENPFNPEKVDKILREVMNEAIENLHYDPDKCSNVAKQASMQIRSKVKQLDFDRYKLVCIVSIGEKNSQDVYAACRFLWDAEKDRYSFYSLENTFVYAIAYCFGLYYE